ncbi:MAG TPA: hypothetical protein VE669_05160 [Actinomycetota bacterium]|jgi:hypothetical protein|nr:hypothetical protein [Actinomycetota bacterium]
MTVRASGRLRDFAKVRPEVEAVLQHIGRETWDLLLIDVEGNWVRDVVSSVEAAEAICRELGLRLHRGWDEPRLARRMNARDHWNRPGGQHRAL